MMNPYFSPYQNEHPTTVIDRVPWPTMSIPVARPVRRRRGLNTLQMFVLAAVANVVAYFGYILLGAPL
jgi:hypothetical protein